MTATQLAAQDLAQSIARFRLAERRATAATSRLGELLAQLAR